MKSLITHNATLEPQTEVHAPEMFDVLSDPAIYEFENDPPESAEWLANRFRKLETRQSKDGSEQWLNWVIKLADGRLAGYVQATALANGVSFVAYELNSKHWRQGIGSAAVTTMLEELKSTYGVSTFVAVLKTRNYRSRALLTKLGFSDADAATSAMYRDSDDESVMIKSTT
jgi:[ribosomal protein S5]-alanine N-acetyltransferase